MPSVMAANGELGKRDSDGGGACAMGHKSAGGTQLCGEQTDSAEAHCTSSLPSDPNSQPPPVLRPSEHTEHLEPELPCGLTTGRGHATRRQNLHVKILALPLATYVMLTSSLTPFKPLFPYGQKKENNSFQILGLS